MKDLSKLTDEEIVQYFKDEDAYHADSSYLNSSKLSQYLKNPAGLPVKETTFNENFEIGSLIHYYFLERDKFDAYTFVDAPSRRDKKYKEFKEETGKDWLLAKDKPMIMATVGVVEKTPKAMDLLSSFLKEVEIPFIKKHVDVNTGEIIQLKCRIDFSIGENYYDIKTTDYLDNWSKSAWEFYSLSNHHYYLCTGKRLKYLVIEKGTGRTALWEIEHPMFFSKGEVKWNKAIEIHNRLQNPSNSRETYDMDYNIL